MDISKNTQSKLKELPNTSWTMKDVHDINEWIMEP
eukprot:CAMPEP_0117425452 /NCGR_PEP_ID=MMETSP0758-20121206/5719_1 /TAXON_ID=63605 /ORGANISM="Percolomonas cosmopolitus, Strain AE-1 (ATCC 50343)" /LENGTH=34 /DNA_ID= /DNA_START= /DNA_END= /DNA_ORIENTATION=